MPGVSYKFDKEGLYGYQFRTLQGLLLCCDNAEFLGSFPPAFSFAVGGEPIYKTAGTQARTLAFCQKYKESAAHT